MVVPAFGFSAGDFINTVGVIARVAKALRETDGAAIRYQQTLLELQQLESVLRHVQALEPGGDNAGIIREVQLCSHICHVPLARFVQKAKAFHAQLGPANGSGDHKTALKRMIRSRRKVQWALAVEREVIQLKLSIAAPLQTIQILLQLESCQRAASSASATGETLALVKRLLAQMDEFRAYVSTNLATNNPLDAMVKFLEGAISEIPATMKNVLPATENAAEDVRCTLRSHTALLQQILVKVDPPAPMISSPSSSTVHRRSLPSVGFDTESASSFDPLAYQIYLVVVFVRRSLSGIMLMLLSILPEVHRLLSSLQAINRAPSLLLSDNILLEDALGRRMSLPFEHFRYWQLVEARLQVAFFDLPGELHVKHSEYHILHLKVGGISVLTKDNWSQDISPGARLAMSFLFPSEDLPEKACPRCRCTTLVMSREAGKTCKYCSLTFRTLPGWFWFERVPNRIRGLSNLRKNLDMQAFKRIHLMNILLISFPSQSSGEKFRRLMNGFPGLLYQ